MLVKNPDFWTSSNYDRKTEKTSNSFEKTFCRIYILWYNTLSDLYIILSKCLAEAELIENYDTVILRKKTVYMTYIIQN